MSAIADENHRLWPAPTAKWSMFQVWLDLAFLHWPVPASTLQPLVPKGFELDLWDNQAWVGVVPFRMKGIRPRGLPPLPWLSAFLELNVRTYVRVADRPGVYFFSLDAANPVTVEVARHWYHLPYFHAKMSLTHDRESIRYRSVRRDRRGGLAELSMSYRPIGPVYHAAKGTFDYWLTERYCLYTTDEKGTLYRGEIDHPPWPLQPAEATFETFTMGRSHQIHLPNLPPIAHFSKRQDVYIWRLERLRETPSS